MNFRIGEMREDIDWAILHQQKVQIKYCDFYSQITHREISPLDWVSPNKINAYCHLRNLERTFRLENILEYRLVEGTPEYPVPSPIIDKLDTQSFQATIGVELAEIPTEHKGEKAQLRKRLKILKHELAESELELATLEAQLITFERRYIQTVGIYLAELDHLEAKIADVYLQLNPKKPEARYQAEAAHERATASEEDVHSAQQTHSNKLDFKPSANLKSLYREICKKIHPDLTIDPAARERRTNLMIEANQAYEDGDESTLRTIFEDFKVNDSEGEGLHKAEINQLKRKIDQILARIQQIKEKMVQLEYSKLYRLMHRVDDAEIEGIDLLGFMAQNLKAKISDRQHTLAVLMQELDKLENT